MTIELGWFKSQSLGRYVAGSDITVSLGFDLKVDERRNGCAESPRFRSATLSLFSLLANQALSLLCLLFLLFVVK